VKRLYIRTFGCQMNLHDSLRMEEVLRPAGYVLTDAAEQAGLIIVNTCSVREKSHEKVLSALGRLGRLKQRQNDLVLAVAGCVAQQEGERLLEMVPAVDLVLGPDHVASLPELVEEVRTRRCCRTGFTDPEAYRFLRAVPEAAPSHGPTALVTIQKGCDNACAYCIVPSVRGPAVSRHRDEVVAEVRDLARVGIQEVTLIGQNVNAYRGGQGTADDFVELLREVDRVPGLARTRFTTSHPKDFHRDMPECFKELRTLCPWLHLPVQSGATAVLERMDRGYSREQYLGRIAAVRDACPDISLGTDLIVGYPGETEEDYQETLSLLEQVRFDYAYSFKFSPRPGTRAAALEDDVPEQEKLRRLRHLQAKQDEITEQRLSRFLGQTLPVLVEGPSRKGLPQLCGRTPGNHVVNIDDLDGGSVGELVEVLIKRAGKHSLTGVVAPSPGQRNSLEVFQCSSR
jgi:tRNA-2-methylthio-N6-dimethylallyladenosine synthase